MFKIACRLGGMTVCELEQRLTFSEYQEWKAFLDIELNQHSKQDWYLAQIAQYCKTIFSKNKGKTKDSLISFRFNTQTRSKSDLKNLRIRLKQALSGAKRDLENAKKKDNE